MALILVSPGVQPIGFWDAKSTDTFKGGEVMQLTTATMGGAADNQDGYINPGTNMPVLTVSLSTHKRPLFLSDDGTAGYGTALGAVVGGAVGQQVQNPSVATYNTLFGATTLIGPPTYWGSGRVTAWGKPGTYGVTLDACASSASTGLQPTNSTLTTGAPLFATSAGLLTPLYSDSFETGTGADGYGLVVGYFVEFRSRGSLVTTPNRLVSATNSPSTVVGGVLPNQMYFAEFEWVGSASANYYTDGTHFDIG